MNSDTFDKQRALNQYQGDKDEILKKIPSEL